MKQAEAFKCPGQTRDSDTVSAGTHIQAVALPAMVQPGYTQSEPEQDEKPVKILDMKMAQALPENPGHVVDLYAHPLGQVRPADSFFQNFEIRVSLHSLLLLCAPCLCLPVQTLGSRPSQGILILVQEIKSLFVSIYCIGTAFSIPCQRMEAE